MHCARVITRQSRSLNPSVINPKIKPITSVRSVWLQTLALWRFTRYLILTALPFKLVNDLSQFVAPTFLNLLLGVVSSGQPSSVGYMYATLMLALLILGTASDNQHFQRVMRGGKSLFLPAFLCLCGFALCLLCCPVSVAPAFSVWVEGCNHQFQYTLALHLLQHSKLLVKIDSYLVFCIAWLQDSCTSPASSHNMLIKVDSHSIICTAQLQESCT